MEPRLGPKKWLLLWLCALWLPTQVAAQNIVTNGDFASGFTGWTSNGAVGSRWLPANMRAELGEFGTKTLSSGNFTGGLVNGAQYVVSFSYGWIGDVTPNNLLSVQIRRRSPNGVVNNFGTIVNDFTGTGSASLAFTSSGTFASAFIRFTGQNAAGNTNGSILWVDDVVVRRVPEIDRSKSTLPLFFVGCLLCLLHSRRTLRQFP